MKSDAELTKLIYEHIYGYQRIYLSNVGEAWEKPNGGIAALERITQPRAWGELFLFLSKEGKHVRLDAGKYTDCIACVDQDERVDMEIGRALAWAALACYGVEVG